MSPCQYCSAILTALFLTIPFVQGWVTRSFHSTIITHHNRISPHSSVCPSISYSPTPSTKHTLPLFASTVEEDEEIIEYLDDEEDDDDDAAYDYEDAAGQQAEWMEELAQLTRTTSRDPTAVERAQEIFDDMFQAYVESDDAIFFPTVDVYNLLLEIHAYSPFPEGGEEAARILGRMEDDSNDFVARPNEDSYLMVMDAWAMRRQPSKAKEILDKQSAPTTNAYNKLIKAYGMTGDFAEAKAVFDSVREAGKANHKSWGQLLKARVASGDDDEDTEEAIRGYFRDMEDDGIEPETDAYNVLVRCLGNTSPQKAEAMLFELMERYRGGEELVKPNAGTFRAVLLAYKNGSKGKVTKQMAAKAEQLLQIYDGLAATTATTKTTSAAPAAGETNLVETALAMISRSRDSRKAVKADRILRKRLLAGGGTPRMMRSVLDACASTNSGNAEEKMDAFKIALEIFKELRALSQDDNGADSTTTGLFLRACHKLMPPGRKRDDVVARVFRECRDTGRVNEFVLGELEEAASDDLQLELLGGFLVDGVTLPPHWRQNAAGD